MTTADTPNVVAVVAETGLYRRKLVEFVSRLRYPSIKELDALYGRKYVDSSTLWLWCDLTGVESGLEWFSFDEVVKVAAIALWFMTGRSKRKFLALTQEELDHLYQLTQARIEPLLNTTL